jgi:uncharacterized membrane protein YidH (DUF202 family)
MTSDSHAVPTTQQLAEYRTVFAAERTLFAVLRTGLAIAGGGSLVSSLLGDAWPPWVQVTLVTVFLVVGYSMTLLGLARYRAALRALHVAGLTGHQPTSPGLLAAGLVLLEIAIVVVVVLFLVESI